jgi:hypothetical protein
MSGVCIPRSVGEWKAGTVAQIVGAVRWATPACTRSVARFGVGTGTAQRIKA